jgi:hypothetical protein
MAASTPAGAAPWRRILCLYHYPCPDGIFAALAAATYHRAAGLPLEMVPNTTFRPATVEGLGLTRQDCVYLLDFAGPPGFARELARAAGRCVVLDHHKTSAEDLAGPAAAAAAPPSLEVHFDMARSGATIALDYFRPAGLAPPQRALFAYIEDSDLWRWALPGSKAFFAGFTALGLDLDARRNPAIFDQLLALTPEAVIAAGEPELARQAAAIAAALGVAHEVALGGAAGAGRGWGRALAVHVGADGAAMRSQLGNALAEEAGRRGLRAVAAVAYEEAGIPEAGAIKVSLRSKGEGEDTTVVAQAYGGGGHRNASSFLIPKAEFEAWRV